MSEQMVAAKPKRRRALKIILGVVGLFVILSVVYQGALIYFAPAKGSLVAWEKGLDEAIAAAAKSGKPVLVTFWATSCPGCVKEMPHFIDLYRELNSRGFELVARGAGVLDPEVLGADQQV